jgi:putative transposase
MLSKDARPKVREHILGYAKEKGIDIDAINVQTEHVHLLLNLKSDQKVEDVVKLIKGESSHWVNSENLIHPKFAWQRGYGAFSVSPSHLDAVRKYIENQDEHHRKKTFAEELKTILRKYGFNETETDESVQE